MRPIFSGFILVATASLGLMLTGCLMLGADRYIGEKSDHFDGERFFNPGVPDKKFSDFLRWQRERKAAPWPKWIESKPGPKPAPAVPAQGEAPGLWRVTFVNHATVLLQLHGVNILTDPVWSERTSPVGWAGPKRVRAPGIRFEDLPKIHIVLLSHNHYDHMDIDTLRRLAERDSPVIYTGLGNTKYLADRGIDGGIDMDWWEHRDDPSGLKIHYVPAQHFSARSMFDRNRTLWGGLVVEAPSGRFYFAGDSGYGPHFKTIGARLGPFRYSLIPIGAYEPRWFMSLAHTNPDEAVRTHLDVRSQRSLGIHFGTFQLTDESLDAPEEALVVARDAHRVSEQAFTTLKPGDHHDVGGSP